MLTNQGTHKLVDDKQREFGYETSLGKKVQMQFAISIVIPTRNESGNIQPLLSRIDVATNGIPTEVIFVDDSTDSTADVIRELQHNFSLQVTLIARPLERRQNGLGGAVLEGFKAAQAPWICVMDADLQHSPEIIPEIYQYAEKKNFDLVVGSRLAPGGDTSGLGFKRSIISHVFAAFTRAVFPVRLKHVTDPLSGFFIFKRESVNFDILRPDGFKILLEIAVRCPNIKISELPIRFGHRHAGESKASLRETIRFIRLVMRLRMSTDQPFLRFLAVGGSGLIVNSVVLAAFTEITGMHYLMSAVMATQASTLWNFYLTESWVFGKRNVDHPLYQRLVSFLLMNNMLLLIRGPLLALLVTQMGMHYLISNLATLIALTAGRYLISERWIWADRRSQNQSPNRQYTQIGDLNDKITPNSGIELVMNQSVSNPFIFLYNIHNILRVASMYQLPELEYFRVADLSDEPDIRLRLERRHGERRHKQRSSISSNDQRRTEKPRRIGDPIHYGESLGRYGFEISIAYKNCVEVAVSPLLQLSLHVLYTNVIEPILRWALVRKGYALVHAACISVDGRAVLVTAQTDTGKTSTILQAVNNLSCSFLSDDMTIIGRDGIVMSYPKPLTISHHTLNAVTRNATLSFLEKFALVFQSRLHSKSGRSIGLRLSKTKLPAATMNTLVQMFIPPPKYMIHRLIPKVIYENRATLSRAVIIERGSEFEEFLGHDQAVEVFVHNAEDAYGFPPYPILANSLSKWNEEDLHSREQAIVADALNEIPTVRLRDPKFNWWQKLSDLTKVSLQQ